MTVKELLFVTGGSVKYRIEPYDKWNIVLTAGVVDDIIDFNDVPYVEHEVLHISIDDGEMVVMI
jgi:hypothetical protein